MFAKLVSRNQNYTSMLAWVLGRFPHQLRFLIKWLAIVGPSLVPAQTASLSVLIEAHQRPRGRGE